VAVVVVQRQPALQVRELAALEEVLKAEMLLAVQPLTTLLQPRQTLAVAVVVALGGMCLLLRMRLLVPRAL
jgi:hypothetical protein